MNRTIVNIISEQTTPNFLFIKEMFQPEDELLFITSRKYEERITWIMQAVGYTEPFHNIKKIILGEGAEEDWTQMYTSINGSISDVKHYIVNLTGGTKYMSLAVLSIFEKLNANFYYIPFPKNVILRIFPGTTTHVSEKYSLKHRMTVEEYMKNYSNPVKGSPLSQDVVYTKKFFGCFIEGKVEHKIISSLREYRNTNKNPKTTDIHIIPKLNDLLQAIEFPIKKEDILSKDEVKYLIGGWFEEYIYNRILETLNPNDIKLGLHISPQKNHQNELDVVFTYGNKLFVVECKTGIDDERMFKDTVYKATSIKNALLGLSANTFIFSLSKSDSTQMNKFGDTAKAMGIYYFDRDYFFDDQKFEELVNTMKGMAKN
ncbi:MAG: DUF1887 family protein [Tannerellaceae bacterium]|nr:DUF1887 family protein [Tannerellaceae bacterium]